VSEALAASLNSITAQGDSINMKTLEIISRTIKFKGIKVTCHSDGSITRYHKSSGKSKRGFGFISHKGYAKTILDGSHYFIHVIIAEAFIGKHEYKLQVDHINGNKLDNRPENLRYLTASENKRAFQSKRKGTSSQYRGVCWDISREKWKGMCRAKTGENEKRKSTKYFDDEKDAAIARDRIAFDFGFPQEGLNFPDLFIDKYNQKYHVQGMDNVNENLERIQTQIEMIRSESRLLSYRIDRMIEQRKKLSEEKRQLKLRLELLGV